MKKELKQRLISHITPYLELSDEERAALTKEAIQILKEYYEPREEHIRIGHTYSSSSSPADERFAKIDPTSEDFVPLKHADF